VDLLAINAPVAPPYRGPTAPPPPRHAPHRPSRLRLRTHPRLTLAPPGGADRRPRGPNVVRLRGLLSILRRSSTRSTMSRQPLVGVSDTTYGTFHSVGQSTFGAVHASLAMSRCTRWLHHAPGLAGCIGASCSVARTTSPLGTSPAREPPGTGASHTWRRPATEPHRRPMNPT
jgi:hypothetical protein